MPFVRFFDKGFLCSIFRRTADNSQINAASASALGAGAHHCLFHTLQKIDAQSFPFEKKGGAPNKGSVYDIAVSILPLGAIGICLGLLETVAVALLPLFGFEAAVVWTGYGLYCGISFVIAYILTLLSAIVLIGLERKRIPKVGFFTMLKAVLLWPFFLGLNVVLDCISFFVKKLEWKVIPHTGDEVKNKKRTAHDKAAPLLKGAEN